MDAALLLQKVCQDRRRTHHRNELWLVCQRQAGPGGPPRRQLHIITTTATDNSSSAPEKMQRSSEPRRLPQERLTVSASLVSNTLKVRPGASPPALPRLLICCIPVATDQSATTVPHGPANCRSLSAVVSTATQRHSGHGHAADNVTLHPANSIEQVCFDCAA